MAERRSAAIEFTFHIRPDDDALGRLTADLDDGTLTAIDDPGDRIWRAYFESPAARDQTLTSLQRYPFVEAARAIDVPDELWAERSQAAIGPVRVGSIVVVPPWRADDPAGQDPGVAHVIVINPSMGFGTGHHASTRRCLALLQTIDLTGARVLDAGTGSGVLAIAARRLGAATVVAIDPDADAIRSAGDSLALNAMTGIELRTCEVSNLAGAEGVFAGALANLTGATIRSAASQLAALVRPDGWLIASGIEVDEIDDVLQALEDAGWREAARDLEDGWVGLRLVRTATSPTATR
ncbi:MAG TPA: 50S ribosomal protein L11 methyltransferase [Vicinamibacterales bacterium]|nr:50S ribosomal protein L11 methyltransferase [Vicinamibacterales bacterium]